MSAEAQLDVAVVGGGPIGLASAWRAARRGLRVAVLDAGEPGAWTVAAGMLAPVAEADRGEEPLLRLGLRAAAGFAAFCAELAEASGRDPGHRASGTLVVARDRDDAEELDRAARRPPRPRPARGAPAARPRARRAEPALAPTVRLALDVPGDHSVDPRRLVAALAEAVERAGGARAPPHARPRAARRATTACAASSCATAPRCRRSGSCSPPAPTPRGSRASRPRPPCPCARSRARCCGCATRAGPGLLDRTVRTPAAYIVPRADGRYVLGATMEEKRLPHRADRRRRCSSSCGTSARSSRACSSSRWRRCWPACGPRRPTTCRPSARARSRACTGRPAITATGSCSPACPASWPPPRCAASRCPTGRPPSTRRASRPRWQARA